jgi:protein gp37
MAENSKIEWCDHTFNPWEGCEKVSAGCANCYAERRDKQYHNGGHWGPNGTRKMMSEAYWRQPLKWNRDAEKTGERPRVFCSSLADVFEDRPELIDPRHRLMLLIEQTPSLDWLLLTKRPENIGDMVPVKWFDDGFPSNVWLGTTVENQEQADKRIPKLLKIPARTRFLSCEPLLGAVDLSRYLPSMPKVDCPPDLTPYYNSHFALHWVIAGGESGSNARPSHSDWFRSLRDQCQAAGVPFFFKQSGEWIGGKFDRRKSKMVCDATEAKKSCGQIFWTNPGAPKVHLWDETDHYWTNASARVGKKAAGRLLDGREWNEFPDAQRCRG